MGSTVLGDTAVGKSSMAFRFATDQFSGNQQPTIGAAFLTKIVTIDEKSIKFEIWDTAGQERYNSLGSIHKLC